MLPIGKAFKKNILGIIQKEGDLLTLEQADKTMFG